MLEIDKIQDNIYKYNEASNKDKLKLPTEIAEFTEKGILGSLFSKWVEKKVSFKSSNDTLHPNLIRYLIINKVCQIKKGKNKKGLCYLENKKKQKIKISKQIYFGYQFVEKLRENKSEEHIKHFFDKDGYLTNLKLEEWVRSWNGAITTRRLDFVFDVGNGKKIIIEYLEKHHLEEYRNWSNYQSIRLVDILFGPYKDDIIHCAFIWDHLMDDEYLNKKVDLFCETCKNHFNIENEEEYIIGILNEHIGNPDLSKLIFDAYKDENKPILSIDDINDLFPIKEEKHDYVKNEFIEKAKRFTQQNDDDDDGFLDKDLKKKEIYYEENDGEIVLSDNGLCLYLDLLREEYFKNTDDYEGKIKFVKKIGKSAYESANKIRDLIINQKKNLISGLEDIKD